MDREGSAGYIGVVDDEWVLQGMFRNGEQESFCELLEGAHTLLLYLNISRSFGFHIGIDNFRVLLDQRLFLR